MQPDDRPNIVLIMADDMGFSDVGLYGGEIETPNLDRLAQNGLRFTRFYNNALCGPTRASLLTGLYSQQVGGHGNAPKLQNCVTIAEVLRDAGYRTLMAGKWHTHPDAGLPVERGFDRHYGLIDGCCNYFNPGVQRPGENPPGKKWPRPRRWAIEDQVYEPYTPEDPNFYTTDAFTDYALKYLDEYGNEGKPFFLYLPYTAPHYPMHAWPEDIAKYRGRYMRGWDTLRRERHERMLEMGIVEEIWGLSPRDTDCPSWDEVEDKDGFDLKMSVYAAMIDRMDRNIGRVLRKIRELGKEENTLVLFLSDNGGTAENIHKTDYPPGPMEGYHTVDAPWANMSNTPFRKFKNWDHEGGISTPLIAYWPRVIREGGSTTDQVGHIIDVMATCIDLAQASYPSTYRGMDIKPLEGKSLKPIFEGKKRSGHDALFWKRGKSRAVRWGEWKLVRKDAGPWELYNIETDRCEMNDLSGKSPDRVARMSRMWDEWAADRGIDPE